MTTAAVIVFGSMLAFIVWYPLRKARGRGMTAPHPAGKGTDRRRYDMAAWDAGYRRIFGSKKKAGRSRKKNVKGKTGG